MPNIRELFDLTGKAAIVTGGSRGLGQEMAEGLAENPGSHDIMKILSGCQARVRDVLRQYVDITMSAGRAA